TTFVRLGNGLPTDSYVLRPIITAWPEVVRLKKRKSLGRCQSSLFSLPMAPVSAAATMADTKGFFIYNNLNGYRCLNMRIRLVVGQLEILITERKNILHQRVEPHPGQHPRFPAQLQFHLFKMVAVQMGVPKCVNEISSFHVTHLGHHHGEQGIRCNVKRHPQENVCT